MLAHAKISADIAHSFVFAFNFVNVTASIEVLYAASKPYVWGVEQSSKTHSRVPRAPKKKKEKKKD